MGGLDCVKRSGITTSDSTEVFSIHVASNSSLNMQRTIDEESQEPMVPRRKSRLVWHLALDLPIIALVLIIILLFELSVLPSQKFGFFCNDPALSFPFHGDTVSMAFLVATLFTVPPIMIFVTEVIYNSISGLTKRLKLSAYITGLVTRDYMYGFLINLLIVELLKGLTGMPRPGFFEICQPDTAKNCSGSEFMNTFTCTSKEFSQWYQQDSYHSFPSGHASLSVYAGLFVAWYLQIRAFKWSNRSAFTVPFVQILCMTYGLVCSITRITDHRHHWWDVLFGVVIGVVTLYLAVAVISKNFSYIGSTKICFENDDVHDDKPILAKTNRPSSDSLLENGQSVLIS